MKQSLVGLGLAYLAAADPGVPVPCVSGEAPCSTPNSVNATAGQCCPQALCGKDNAQMTDACMDEIKYIHGYLMNPRNKGLGLYNKYIAGGISADGDECSIQAFLRDVENKTYCPQTSFPMFCVQNKCQNTDGTSSPTPAGTPQPPLPATQPSFPDVPVPPVPAPAAKTCGNDGPNLLVCATRGEGFVPSHNALACTACDAAQCCRMHTCAEEWDVEADPLNIDHWTMDETCQNHKEGTVAAGQKACLKCDFRYCCVTTTCPDTFTGTCPAGQRPQRSDDEMAGCDKCDESECCIFDDDAQKQDLTPSPADDEPDVVDGGGSGVGGVIAGVILGLAATGACGFFFYRRHKRKGAANGFVNLNDDGTDYAPPVDDLVSYDYAY